MLAVITKNIISISQLDRALIKCGEHHTRLSTAELGSKVDNNSSVLADNRCEAVVTQSMFCLVGSINDQHGLESPDCALSLHECRSFHLHNIMHLIIKKVYVSTEDMDHNFL